MSREGWCQAALLACGDESVLGHGTACLLWRMRRCELFPLSVIVTNSAGRKHDRIRARRMNLDRGDWMILDGEEVAFEPATTAAALASLLGP